MTRAVLQKKDKDVLQKKDPQSVFVCTWHPKLKRLPTILNENHKILNSDTKPNIDFPSKSTVAFRRKKHLASYLCHNDVKEKYINEGKKCKGCILCKQMSTIKNKNSGAELKLKCKKCDHIHIGHTGDPMSERFSKHKYDLKNTSNKMNWRRTSISTNIVTPKKI